MLAGDAGHITGCFFVRIVTSSVYVFLYERELATARAVVGSDYVAALDIPVDLLQRRP